mmetsp:Transcript_105904/g.330241  ORF Transcript_105904/g.330241 Transcript_105904/m.330241 type:complete len:237 (-) Transcript_105904:409-1119(-)
MAKLGKLPRPGPHALAVAAPCLVQIERHCLGHPREHIHHARFILRDTNVTANIVDVDVRGGPADVLGPQAPAEARLLQHCLARARVLRRGRQPHGLEARPAARPRGPPAPVALGGARRPGARQHHAGLRAVRPLRGEGVHGLVGAALENPVVGAQDGDRGCGECAEAALLQGGGLCGAPYLPGAAAPVQPPTPHELLKSVFWHTAHLLARLEDLLHIIRVVVTRELLHELQEPLLV